MHSAIRDQIRARSADLVLRETITLPKLGVEVRVRGLMVGEVERAGKHERSNEVQIALSTEDPATGNLIWNPGAKEHLDEIAALHVVDATTIVKISNRLSGIAELGKMFSPPATNGSTPSPSDSGEPSGS